MCYFRVVCLIVALGCFVCGCVMNDDAASKNKAELADNSAASSEQQTVHESAAEDSVSSDDLRELAVIELSNDSQYLQTCGALDKSFSSCSVSLSERLKPYYSLSYESSDDGYSLSLKAKDSNDDKCHLFEANSEGEMVAYDRNGKENSQCLTGAVNDADGFKIRRDTDNMDGQSAPSGFTPIVRNLSSR